MHTNSATLRWHCPHCRTALESDIGKLICTTCARTYPVIGDIPDLRVNLPSWIDVDTDRRNALRLSDLSARLTTEELVAEVFRQRGWPAAEVNQRTTQMLQEPAKLEHELDDWLGSPTTAPRGFLEVGCGGGSLLAAAAARGRHGTGIDVSLEWLVVAQRFIKEHGGTPRLAAAMAEALPFGDASTESVVSLDVAEHVGDQHQYLREISRVLVPGGVCALVTPNRFSLSAEPHVRVWGVGWLPRKWQSRYVHWRTGKPYEYCRLLSVNELTRMMRGYAELDPQVLLGEIPGGELARFSPPKALAARAYNRVLQFRLGRNLLTFVCPFFRILARKTPV